MTELNEQERTILAYIEAKIDFNTDNTVSEAINYLMSLSYTVLIYISAYSDKLHHFLHFNFSMLSTMGKKLKENHYIHVPVYSMDNQEKHDIFDHYLSALMVQEYFTKLPTIRRSAEAKRLCLEILHQASELGLYNALIVQCEHKISQAKMPGLSITAREEIIQYLIISIKRLTNLYWSIGHLQAGSLWQSLGDYFFNKEEEKNYGIELHKTALKHFLCAFLLRNYPMSINIMDSLTQGKGLTGVAYEENSSPQTWDEFHDMIYSWVDGEQYENILSLAKQEIQNTLSQANTNEQEWKKAA